MVVVTCIGDVLILNISAGGYIFLFPCYMKTTTKRGKLVLYFKNFFFFIFCLCPTIFSPFGDRLMNTIHTHTHTERNSTRKMYWLESIYSRG